MQDKFNEKETANQTQSENVCPQTTPQKGLMHDEEMKNTLDSLKESEKAPIYPLETFEEKQEPLHIRKQREMLIEDREKLLEMVNTYFGQDGLAIPIKSLNTVYDDWMTQLPEEFFNQNFVSHINTDITRIITFLAEIYDAHLSIKRRVAMIEGK